MNQQLNQLLPSLPRTKSYDGLTMDQARRVVARMPDSLRDRMIDDLRLQLAAIGDDALDDWLVEQSCLVYALLVWDQGGADVEPERKPQYGRMKIVDQT